MIPHFSHPKTTEVQDTLVADLTAAFKANESRPLLFFYSGGSAFEVLGKLSTSLFEHKFSASNVWFAPIDERFDVTASNYQAFRAQAYFSKFEKMGGRFIDVLSHGGSLEDCAYWYSEWVRVETDKVHIGDGKVISLLGMGPDGHTAGLFPYPENELFFEGEFINTTRYATGYDVGDKNPYRERITLTVPALKHSDSNFAYVVGANKQEALFRVAHKEGSIAATPALVWHELTDLKIYTDIDLH